MKNYFVPNAIDALSRLFFTRTTRNDYLAMKTLEFYISELQLLEDAEAVATVLERQQNFALLPKLYLFDSIGAEKVEMILAGKVSK